MLDRVSLVLSIIGGINWLLVGLFRFDLVAYLFGGASRTARCADKRGCLKQVLRQPLLSAHHGMLRDEKKRFAGILFNTVSQ